MSKSLPKAGLSESEWEPKLPFDLVVAYEDRATRNRAMHLYDHLAQQLLDECDFKCAWWKFDHLADPALREQSIEDAARANMVILSLHARPEMAPAQTQWVESWLALRDQRKSALVALIGDSAQSAIDTAPMLGWLRNAARLGHMDFFDHAFGIGAINSGVMEDRARRSAEADAPPLKNTLDQRAPTTRWGINE